VAAVAAVRAAADPRSRAAGALPAHAADRQGALADVDGRVVPERVLGAAGAAVGADLIGRRRSGRRRARPPRCSARTSAPIPASCWPRRPCRCGRAAGHAAADLRLHGGGRGAAANRLALAAAGVPAGHPTREALGGSRRSRWAPSSRSRR
jgi:hypothetical protein